MPSIEKGNEIFFCALLLCFVLFGLGNKASAETAPATLATASAQMLPVGQTVYKIAISEDALYEVSYEMLDALGVHNLATLDPASVQMMQRGAAVAYELLHDGDASFEPGEKVLFYGWAFSSSRYEEQFVNDNIFWLWFDGAVPQQMTTTTNPVRNAPITTAPATVTLSERNWYTPSYSHRWETYENEATSWFTQLLYKTDANTPLTHSFTLNAPHAAASGPDATLSTEIFSEWNILNHIFHVSLNGNNGMTRTWSHRYSGNVVQTVPQSVVNAGSNQVDVTVATARTDLGFVKQIDLHYTRNLVADDNQLSFRYESAGSHEFEVSGYSGVSADDMRVLDITDPHQPVRIPLTASDVATTRSAGQTVRFAADQSASIGRWLATSLDNAQTPAVSTYHVEQLMPVSGAQWIAITWPDFRPQADRLAAHRSSFSNMTTHVVDSDDVINQYGYGLPLPSGIQDFLKTAYSAWSIQPEYVLLLGTGSINARSEQCPTCPATWSNTSQLIPTDLVFKDRARGQVASDYIYALLAGDDNRPDVSVGRIAASTLAEAKSAVDKTLQYEANLVTGHGNPDQYLFAADDADTAGDFCNPNEAIMAGYIFPNGLSAQHYCLDTYINNGNDQPELNSDLISAINAGGGVLNYRGHGSTVDWGHQGGIMKTSDSSAWQNGGHPLVILSADCLDGNFASPTHASFGTTYQLLDGKRGSAAHWSSSGLGYAFEHDVLYDALYDALFNEGHSRLGDMVDVAKTHYLTLGYSEVEAYSFILQGDPAITMKPIATDSGFIAGPFAASRSSMVQASPGNSALHVIDLSNLGTAADSFTVFNPADGTTTTSATLASLADLRWEVDVPVSATAIPGSTFETTIVITSTTDPLASFELTLTTQVTAPTATSVQLTGLDTASSGAAPVILIALLTLGMLTASLYVKRRAS